MAHYSPGDLLAGRFEVESVAGTGGMSTVYRAVDSQLGRVVAVKVFPAAVSAGVNGRRRESEVRLLASLDHPALVTLFDVVDIDDATLIVMQYIDGDDLGARIGRGALPYDETASMGAAIASALASVHARGIIHRDIKPGNILLPADRTIGAPPALLADFGIARLIDDTTLTAAGSIVGTAHYLSPEQARGVQPTTASDVYSLGLVLLESLTGRRTFAGSGVESVVVRLTQDPVIPPTLSESWRALLHDMTVRDPAARPSASDVAAALSALGSEPETSPVATAPLASAYTPTRRYDAVPEGGTTEALSSAAPATPRRRPLVVGGAVLAALVIGAVVASVALTHQTSDEVAPPPSTTSATPTPTPTVSTVVGPAPAESVAPTDPKTPPGKVKPCKGKSKKKDC